MTNGCNHQSNERPNKPKGSAQSQAPKVSKDNRRSPAPDKRQVNSQRDDTQRH